MAGSGASARHIFLTGTPGIGKTTLIHKACQSLNKAGLLTQGFYTEEVRVNGRRTGFDVVTLNGRRGPLARVSEQCDTFSGRRREYRVGQYSVDLQSFEQTAMPTINTRSVSPGQEPVFVIDEIGKMELFSQSFVQSVRGILDNPMTTVLATIPVSRGKPISFVEEVRNRKDAVVYTVTRENRDNILKEIVESVKCSVETFNS
ncbi:cancer-related nucleoside-triphosphatase-like [Haliotis rufescens]|uniref:cancer-related nucleoside-triphosphatase-like n=1 Tax=Haliotis rufescens TaxID=6454 RepID=UPI00201EA20A|nr:cancer-related nucleoside-triphosphatase-like [Haliotis rufescens]